MAYTPKAGSAGRVRIGATTVAGLTKWGFRQEVGEIEVTHFESSTNANSVIESQWLSDNISNVVVDVEGFIDYDTTNSFSLFAVGVNVAVDLITQKGAVTNAGFENVPCFVKSLGPNVELKQGQKFTATLRVYGAMPAFSSSFA